MIRHMPLTHPSRNSGNSKVIWFVVLLALLLRLLFYPDSRVRDVDEVGYVHSGMMLAEGLTPTYKATPAGPQIWLSWAYVMASSAKNLLRPAAPERALPVALKPYGAVNAALFDLYRDQTPLRRVHLAMTIGFGLLAVWAAARLGQTYAGDAGALLLGGTLAVSELFVSYSLMTRPYICGWSLTIAALLLIVQADQFRSFNRLIFGFVMLGLAVGSRIEMLTVLPLALWAAGEFLHRRPVRTAALLTAVTGGTAVMFAPWLVTSLITNMKSVVAVRAVGVMPSGPGQALHGLVLEVGLGFILAAAAIGTIHTYFTRSLANAVALTIFGCGPILMSLKGTGYGIRHDGGALICSVFLAAIGCQTLAAWNRPFLTGLSMISILLAGTYTLIDRTWRQPISTDAPVAAWLETHIKPGSRLIYAGAARTLPLPTAASADAMWRECATTAWLDKYQYVAKQLNMETPSEFPRALSVDNMSKEYTAYRSWFILGGRSGLPVRRFDIFPSIGLTMRENIDPVADYLQHDAVYVLSTTAKPAAELGNPVIHWDGEFGVSTYIFAKPATLEN